MNQDHPSRWRAGASPGGLIGLVLTILAIIVAAASVLGISGRADLPVPNAVLWVTFSLSVLAALVLAFLLWAYLSISYVLDVDRLRIKWGIWSDEVEFADVDSIGPLTEFIDPQSTGWQPFWPGYYIGTRHADSGTVQVVSTQPPRRQLLVRVSDGRQFAISPERPILFLEEFQRARATSPGRAEATVAASPEPVQQLMDAGWTAEYSTLDIAAQATATATAPAREQTEPAGSILDSAGRPSTVVYRSRPSSTSPLLRPILLQDPVALVLLGLGVLATVSMAIYILIQYQDIPPSLTLHWNVDGLPGRVGEPREIWILPTIAALVLIANFGLAWSIALFDRFAARLMLGSTVIVHIVTWVALVSLLR